MQDLELDHVGFVGPDLADMRAEWRRLGFLPTSPQPLFARSEAGERIDLHQRSCHVMLEQGYLEITELRDPPSGHHLSPWIGRGPGLCIVAYRAADVHELRSRLDEPGLSPVMSATRDIDYGDSPGAIGGTAQFLWFMRDPALTPAALECVVEHRSPELIFQACVQRQPNSVHALRGVEIADDRVVRLVLAARDLAAVRECLAAGGVPFTEAASMTRLDAAPSSSIQVVIGSASDCLLQFIAD